MNNPFDHTHIQEEKAEREARRLKLRTNLLIALFCGVLGGFCLVLYQLQVVQGASYRAGTNSHITDRQQVESIRGEILDRYGRVLVTNELSYNVELDWNAMEPDQRLDILACWRCAGRRGWSGRTPCPSPKPPPGGTPPPTPCPTR